jgi:hypothetical protein
VRGIGELTEAWCALAWAGQRGADGTMRTSHADTVNIPKKSMSVVPDPLHG